MRSALKRWLATGKSVVRDRLRWPTLRRRGEDEGRFRASRRAHGRFPRRGRAYRLYLPAAASRRDNLPLLVMLHGCTQDAQTFAEGTRMNALADQHGFIVLYPEQSRRANSFGCWNWFDSAAQNTAGEATILVKIIRRVTRRYGVDPTRVYVAGMSAGGAMAAVLAIRHGALFAGCAIHSGVMYGAASTPATALGAMRRGSDTSPQAAALEVAQLSRRFVFVPTVVIHGSRDDTVRVVNADQIVAQMQSLAELDGASRRPLVAADERRIETAGRAYQLQEYVRDGRPELCKIVVDGLGHAWSGGDERHAFNDSMEPDSSQLVWNFVSRFQRPAGGKGARMRSALRRWLWRRPMR